MEKNVFLVVLTICGANAIALDAANRITSGSLAIENQFPYAVSVQQMSQAQLVTRGHRCGGVLITLQHVLTSAACTFNNVNGVPVQITPAEYRVFAGANDLANDTVQERIRYIANITVHPQYIASPALINDIAIITLTVPFANTTAVPLPLPVADFGPADFTLCTTAGWGSENLTATATTALRYTTKYIYSQSLCTALYSTLPGMINIFPTMICAASYDIVSSGCIGDQGNALVCNGGLAGILSQSNYCTASSFPEVYTRVSNYTTWITSVTGGASTFKPGMAVLGIFVVLQIITIKIIS